MVGGRTGLEFLKAYNCYSFSFFFRSLRVSYIRTNGYINTVIKTHLNNCRLAKLLNKSNLSVEANRNSSTTLLSPLYTRLSNVSSANKLIRKDAANDAGSRVRRRGAGLIVAREKYSICTSVLLLVAASIVT